MPAPADQAASAVRVLSIAPAPDRGEVPPAPSLPEPARPAPGGRGLARARLGIRLAEQRQPLVTEGLGEGLVAHRVRRQGETGGVGDMNGHCRNSSLPESGLGLTIPQSILLRADQVIE
jgi:hypothetical protein